MKRCDNCGIIIYDERTTCPLCHKVLTERAPGGNEPSLLPDAGGYPDVRLRYKRIMFVMRLVLFIFVVAEIASVIVNRLTTPGIKWSILSAAGMLYIYLCMYFWIRNNSALASKIGFSIILTMLITVLADYWTGYYGWSLTWAVPGLVLLGDGVIFFFMMINKQSWYSYLLLLLIFVLCSIAINIYFHISGGGWKMLPSISFIISALFLLGTYIFGEREFGGELKRRFHI